MVGRDVGLFGTLSPGGIVINRSDTSNIQGRIAAGGKNVGRYVNAQERRLRFVRSSE
jgi:hypothetical protein